MRHPLMIPLLVAFTSSAQAQNYGETSQPASDRPYAGLQRRTAKALSDEQMANLRAGRGMDLALPAELNGYPGPIHALELAEQLGLSKAQRARLQELIAAMKAEAAPLGERIIAEETDLDRQFAEKRVTPASLEAATTAIGATQGSLRLAHRRYHLATLELLTERQVRRYGELRGYGGPGEQAPGGTGHH